MKKIAIIISVVVVVLVGLWFFSREPKVTGPVRKEIYNFDPAICPGKVVNFAMADPYMRGIVEEGQVVEVTLNWYACHPMETGDLVLYRFTEFGDPVIRRVVGKPGDKFALISQKGAGWYLKINGKVVNGVNGGYFFGDPNYPPPLSLAEVQKKGVIAKTDLIVFSSFGPGEKDSGVFGMVSVSDMVGKVTDQHPEAKEVGKESASEDKKDDKKEEN